MPNYQKFQAMKSALKTLSSQMDDYEKDFGMDEEMSESDYQGKANGDSKVDQGFDSPDADNGGANPPTNLGPEMDSSAPKAGGDSKKKKMAMMSSMLKTQMSKSKMSY